MFLGVVGKKTAGGTRYFLGIQARLLCMWVISRRFCVPVCALVFQTKPRFLSPAFFCFAFFFFLFCACLPCTPLDAFFFSFSIHHPLLPQQPLLAAHWYVHVRAECFCLDCYARRSPSSPSFLGPLPQIRVLAKFQLHFPFFFFFFFFFLCLSSPFCVCFVLFCFVLCALGFVVAPAFFTHPLFLLGPLLHRLHRRWCWAQ